MSKQFISLFCSKILAGSLPTSELPSSECLPSLEGKNELKIGVISDTHVHKEHMAAFSKYLRQHRPKYDLVFHCGDFSNVWPPMRSAPDSHQIELNSQNDFISTIQWMKTEENFGDKVPLFFVPGNHDSKLLTDRKLDCPGATNLSHISMQILPDLVILGQGGSSIPVRMDKDGNWTQWLHWGAFPYDTDEEFGRDLKDGIVVGEEKFGSEKSYILLTHMGPWDSKTCIFHDDVGPHPIMGGSKANSELLKTHPNIFLQVHGHTHFNQGDEVINGARVVNAGSIVVDKRFAEIDIKRNEATGKWEVKTVNLFKL